MNTTDNDYLKQLDSLLVSGNQSWLFGAGISLNANIPLMQPLTRRVFKMAEGKPEKDLLDAIQSELPDTAHIEHILSQIGDYATIAERSKSDDINIDALVKSISLQTKQRNDFQC